MRIALHAKEDRGAQFVIVLSDEEARHLCQGYPSRSVPKLQVTGTIKDGLLLNAGERGYSLTSRYNNDGIRVRIAPAAIKARTGGAWVAMFEVTPERTRIDDRPAFKLPPMPDLSEAFNPALRLAAAPPAKASPPACETPPAAVQDLASAPQPELPPQQLDQVRRAHILDVVSRHSAKTPGIALAPATGRRPSPVRQIAAVNGPVPDGRGGVFVPKPIPAASPPVIPVAPPAPCAPEPETIKTATDLKTAIEIINDILATSKGGVRVRVVGGRLVGQIGRWEDL